MNKFRRMYNNIQQVKSGSGYNTLKAYSELKKAKKMGFKYSEYISGKMWNKSEESLKLVMTRKEYAEKISSITGWDISKSTKELARARELGVKAKAYLDYYAYEMTHNELSELGASLKALNQKYRDGKDWYINVVMDHTGWDYGYAKHRMDIAANKGYSYRKYITHALYRLSDTDLENVPKFEGNIVYSNVIGDKNRRSEIKEEMGWNDGQLSLNYLKTRIASGASSDEYYLYRLYRMTPEESKKYITMETHLKMQIRYCDYGGNFSYFDDKGLFCDKFKDFIKRKHFLTTNLTFEEFEEKISDLKSIVVKPINGLAGAGVEKFDVNSNQELNKEIFDTIMEKGDCIIEECLIQHKDIAEFYPNSVNTIRIMSLVKDGKCNILNSVIKFGTSTVADNLAEGGIAAGIDISTGTIVTDGVNKKGQVFKSHPITGKTFKGNKIPYWEKVLETCKEASKVIPNMPYIGWDIAIKENGDVAIIEGNHNQAGFLVQFPFAISEQQGMRHTIEPYLWF